MAGDGDLDDAMDGDGDLDDDNSRSQKWASTATMERRRQLTMVPPMAASGNDDLDSSGGWRWQLDDDGSDVALGFGMCVERERGRGMPVGVGPTIG
uniref:Uncharacterized protein n=1 Tax=Oryza meridionalis TaxID=40149 RepID=A0A0E0DCE8_9ORYZ